MKKIKAASIYIGMTLLTGSLFLLSGCGADKSKEAPRKNGEAVATETVSNETNSGESAADIGTMPSLPEEKTDGQYKDEQYEITMDEVKKLSAKKDLSLTDLYAYGDRKETEQGFAYYAFSYDGVEYTLDIYTKEQGELEGARLVRCSDYLSIDIRNGNIEHLLTSDVSVADYLTVELPQGMAVGAYDMYMSDFGGSRIDTEETKNEEIPCGKIRLMHGDTPVFADEKLTDIAFNDNNLYAVTKESISDLPAPCLFMELTEDGDTETEWWAAYFAKEGVSDIGYLVQLKKDCFTKEEALDVVKSVQFAERTFGVE